MSGRTYTDEEVHEILRRAVERGSTSDHFTREELLAAAGEVGIEQHAVGAAIEELDAEREIGAEMVRRRAERRRGFTSAVATWAIVCAVLFGINWAGAGGELSWGAAGGWVYWVTGVWAMVLLLKLKGAVLMSPERERRRAEKSLETQRRRRERQRAQSQRRASSKRLEETIERGVEELLSAVARRVEGAHRGANEWRWTGRPTRVRTPEGSSTSESGAGPARAGKAYRVDGDEDDVPAGSEAAGQCWKRS